MANDPRKDPALNHDVPPPKNASINSRMVDTALAADEEPIPKEALLQELKGQQYKLAEFLYGKGRVRWSQLRVIDCWRGDGEPTDEAVLKALKRLAAELVRLYEVHRVELRIEETVQRVELVIEDLPDK